MQTCAQCLTPFEPRSNSGKPQRYCSKSCANSVSQKLSQKPCSKCGKLDRNTSGRCKICAAAQAKIRAINLTACAACGSTDRSRSGYCKPCRKAYKFAKLEQTGLRIKCEICHIDLPDYKGLGRRLKYCSVSCRNKAGILMWNERYQDNRDEIIAKERSRKVRVMSIPEGHMSAAVVQAKSRAKKNNMAFNINIDDLLPLPEYCPVLGVRLTYGAGNGRNCPTSPSIDRIDSSIGYIKGNVWIISWRANTIKNNATLDELRMVTVAVERKMLDVRTS